MVDMEWPTHTSPLLPPWSSSRVGFTLPNSSMFPSPWNWLANGRYPSWPPAHVALPARHLLTACGSLAFGWCVRHLHPIRQFSTSYPGVFLAQDAELPRNPRSFPGILLMSFTGRTRQLLHRVSDGVNRHPVETPTNPYSTEIYGSLSSVSLASGSFPIAYSGYNFLCAVRRAMGLGLSCNANCITVGSVLNLYPVLPSLRLCLGTLQWRASYLVVTLSRQTSFSQESESTANQCVRLQSKAM
ncbi:hypothetical protein B0H63DRAFT_290471 [Podospora didyma]|uniref:Uncharacterized protein n=1 Tax=Podospora didyma TaxID=330526 RepID=A0AAE0K9X4_9PEZI|nr:hypothetical protein B0H63DRAFT_290471 [Podospora didyma]